MGGGYPGVYGNFGEILEKFPGNFQKLWGMSELFNMILHTVVGKQNLDDTVI